MLYGLTLDNPWNADPIAQKLAQIKGAYGYEPLVRVVLDPFEDTRRKKLLDPREYVDCLRTLSAHADLYATLCDSQEIAYLSERQCAERAIKAWAALAPFVKLWQVGNESNGEWCGRDAGKKIEATFRAISPLGARCALGLYQDEEDTWDEWALMNVPLDMGSKLEFVGISSYPHDNSDFETGKGGWQQAMSDLGTIFPQALIGIDECGMDPEKFSPKERKACFEHYYTDVVRGVTHPRFIGGLFHWYQSDFFTGAQPLLWFAYKSVAAKGSAWL